MRIPVLVLSALVVALAVALAGCGPEPQPDPDSDPDGPARAVLELSDSEIERNNHGVALMGQYRNEEAREVFAGLAGQRPEWLDVRVNKAIAVLNRQQEGDEQRALEIAEAVIEEDPGHLRALYIAGLMYFYLGDAERALDYFERVAAGDPEDAYVAYFSAQALVQLGRTGEATDRYRRAIELDPYLRSAYYGAALSMRQSGDAEGARAMLAAYQRFENNPRAGLAEFRYTRMGPKAEAVAVDPPAPRPVAEPDGPLFGASRSIAALDLEPAGLSLTTADIAGNGRQDLLVAGGAGQGNRLFEQTETGFRAAAGHALNAPEGVNAVLWGDFDNDGLVEAYLCRSGPNRLFKRADDGWEDIAGAAGVADAGDCVDGAVFDADHDGDLDLFVVNGDGANELYSNNLDGSFRRLSREVDAGLDGGPRASLGMLAVDLDSDRIADMVVIHRDPPHQVLINDRLWQYRPGDGFEALVEAELLAISAGDFNADGRTALVSVDSAGELALWRADSGGRWRARRLAGLDISDPHTVGLAVLDLNGDGRPEILVHHAGGFAAFGVAGDQQGAELLFSESARLAALAPVLVDAERGPSLVGVVAGGDRTELVLWPPGEGRHAFTAVAPTGRSERGEGMRSNASGIGTGLVVRVGGEWIVTDSYDRHSAPGQSLQPVAIGLGGKRRADFIRLFWTDGVLQTEMDLADGEVHRIAETQRQLASCPVLFAWNGERYDFVSDLLGVAGIGFFMEPGVYARPRPWEFFRFPEGSIAPRDGRYEIKIAEPMEEIAYIDTARLHVYDLPPGWAVALDERMHTGGGPAPTGEAVFYRQQHVMNPARAVNDRGEDVTEAVLHADHEAAPPGQRHPHFLGRLKDDHVLTLEFDGPINPPGSRAVMVARGWVEYPYSQTVFSAWQAGAEYRPPSLEARSGGQWHMVYEQWGYPAGMPREMSLPLDDLPAGTTALRIRGNWEVYWDRIKVVNAEPPPASLVVHQLGVVRARVAKTGFARRDTFDQRLPYYDYNDRSPFWDTKYPTGYYTALGPVEPLVAEANDAFAVIGPGEEVHLEFAAPEPAPEGVSRVVVLEVRGYAKDMDLYTRDGSTVGPLPRTPGVGDEEIREQLHQHYLNRFQGGH